MSSVRAAAAALMFLVVGCTFEAVPYEGTAYQCGANGLCPDGFDCVANVCVAAGEGPDTGPDAGADGGSDTGPDAGPPAPDAAPGVEVWTFDSAAEFAAGDPTLSELGIASRGALEASAYLTGALLARGSGAFVFDDEVSTTWASVVAGTQGTRVGVVRGADLDYRSAPARGVGITASDNWTVRAEGEIWLEAGTWTFVLDADDRGFVEIAAGGRFTRVVTARYAAEGTGTFTASRTGWYPLRWAHAEATGSARFLLEMSGPGVTRRPVPRHRLRTPVDGLAGLVQVGFDDQRGKGDLAARIDQTELANILWRTDGPVDLGLTSNDYFTVRWSGQLRLDVAGEYTFRYLSDDGQRLWIDGIKVLDRWDEVAHNQVTPPLALAAGWHDIVIDLSEASSDAGAELRIETGPELAGQPLPLARLRPVEGRGERFESAVNRSDVAIPDAVRDGPDGVATSSISLVGPAGATATAVDLSYTIDHEYLGDLRVLLVPPSGPTVTLRARQGSGPGRIVSHMTVNVDGAPVNGTWTLRVEDEASVDVGRIEDFQLTVHHAAGEPPIATTASYTSPLRDLGTGATIHTIRWDPRAPAGTGVAIRVRTGDTPEATAAAAWSAPLATPAGSPAPFSPRRYLQWRAELTSNGEDQPTLELLQIDYRPGS